MPLKVRGWLLCLLGGWEGSVPSERQEKFPRRSRKSPLSRGAPHWGALPATMAVRFLLHVCPEQGGSFGVGSRLPREFIEGVCLPNLNFEFKINLNSGIHVEEGTQN